LAAAVNGEGLPSTSLTLLLDNHSLA